MSTSRTPSAHHVSRRATPRDFIIGILASAVLLAVMAAVVYGGQLMVSLFPA